MIQKNMNKVMSVKQNKKIMIVLLNRGNISWRWIIREAKYSEGLKIMKNKTQK